MTNIIKTVQQQATRRSARIAARTTSSNASATTKSAHHSRNVTAARNNKRKRIVELYEESTSTDKRLKQIATSRKAIRKAIIPTNETKVVSVEEGTSDRNTDKRLKQVEPSTTISRKAITSTSKKATIPIHETKVVSVDIQDAAPQITTIAEQKWGKATSSVLLPTRKRGNNVVEDDHEQILKSKRRKWNTFIVPIPTLPKRIGQVYAIGSNDMSQCGGIKESEIKKLSIIPLEKFKIVDISAGALHSAALTSDGKVVTWGCNDHGTLGRFTKFPNSTAANKNIYEENEPEYAEGLDNINIVKVVCGDNITFAISDQGHLYATGVFKGKDGIIGFSQNNKIEQPIFTRYTPLEHLSIVDIVTGANHALALTREGDVYAWGSNEGRSLGLKECELLVPFNLGLKHIVQLYTGAYHNFAIDDNNNVWVFGLNNMGQCGLEESKKFITPKKHSFFNEVDQNVDEIAAGQHHTLARMHDGQVFSFGRSDSGQLGLGNNVISDKRIVTPTVIPNLTSIKFIGAREHYSMAIDTLNKIYAWGFGETLVLENEVTSPFQISDLNGLEGKDIIRISCGSLHALFLVA
ncbi:regulator of chromosome condensation 1/beta-lactamase-inhibitor protein II [Rhizophagus diaphanus]|nr:regulator of chromosome condensation 1/beta-lactamase-inhibitor protein II [Rhizophagus diaphanus] [Rhizophagus sp. MUCL 43196]